MDTLLSIAAAEPPRSRRRRTDALLALLLGMLISLTLIFGAAAWLAEPMSRPSGAIALPPATAAIPLQNAAQDTARDAVEGTPQDAARSTVRSTTQDAAPSPG